MVESKLCVGNCLGLHQRQNSSRLWVTGLPSKSDCHSLGKVQGESYLFRCSFGSRYLSHVSEWIIEELWGIVVNSSIYRGYICLLWYRGGYNPCRVASPPLRGVLLWHPSLPYKRIFPPYLERVVEKIGDINTKFSDTLFSWFWERSTIFLVQTLVKECSLDKKHPSDPGRTLAIRIRRAPVTGPISS